MVEPNPTPQHYLYYIEYLGQPVLVLLQFPSTQLNIPGERIETGRNRFNLPDANHMFLPGHRLMIQVQSSWFSLYDRNPQTYVSNIFLAKPSDYQKATIKIFDAGESTSFVELPVGSADSQIADSRYAPSLRCSLTPARRFADTLSRH